MAKEEELIELTHPEYWNQRYVLEKELKQGEDLGSFEWFRDFTKLRAFFAKHLPAPSNECHILHLGCGNSVCFPFSIHRVLFYSNRKFKY